jgi:hypothetical protein
MVHSLNRNAKENAGSKSNWELKCLCAIFILLIKIIFIVTSVEIVNKRPSPILSCPDGF